MLSLEDMMKEREKKRIQDATVQAVQSGGLSGALFGGLGSALSGKRSLLKIAGDAALAGLGAGGIAGGATYLGSSLMGAPAEGESGGFTDRALLGGALAGGAAGAGFGGLLGAGKLKWLSKVPGVAAKLETEGPLNNIITDQIKKVAKKGPGRTAAALGVGGAAIGGGLGANEGMAIDYLESLDDGERRRHGPY